MFDSDNAAMVDGHVVGCDSHTYPSRLDPGVYLSDPQGHAQLVGTNDRSLRVIDLHGLVDVGGIHVTSPEVLEEFAARLQMLAGRLRNRQMTKAETA